jgi:methionine synthase II (cobalamin-independent)
MLPSPSLLANFWDTERAPADYRSLEDFLADVAKLLREEADELEAMGATYLQLDRPITRWSVDDLARRIEAASRYVPLGRLGVSPQCGFATSVWG